MRRIKNIDFICIICILVISIFCLTIYWFYIAPKRVFERDIISMLGSPVNLNFHNIKCYYNGKDTSFIAYPQKKLVVFVDSTSCSGCFINKLCNYTQIDKELKSRHSDLLVIIHPQYSDINAICAQLAYQHFPFWCVVDGTGEFIVNNPFISNNQVLHTFALSENNKIILIGDILRNQQIKKLYDNVFLNNPISDNQRPINN